MQAIRDAILSGDRSQETFSTLAIPEAYRGATVHKDEVGMFEGLATRDKDPRKSLHIDDVPVPELAPGEALVAVMASAINYNTVWTSIFEPLPTFGFLERYGRTSEYAKRHDLPYHVVGSDLAGVVLRVGPGVTKWKPGPAVSYPPVTAKAVADTMVIDRKGAPQTTLMVGLPVVVSEVRLVLLPKDE